MNVHLDVIIIDAGPAGYAAAYDLSHAGYKVLLASDKIKMITSM